MKSTDKKVFDLIKTNILLSLLVKYVIKRINCTLYLTV